MYIYILLYRIIPMFFGDIRYPLLHMATSTNLQNFLRVKIGLRPWCDPHVPWFSHCFATRLGFSAMAKPKPKKQYKITRPNSLRLLPILGCAICFFVLFCFLFLGFFVF